MATSTLGSGTLVLAGTTSGTTTVTATAVAGTTTLTLPAATDTLVGKATTDTLTNKTLTSPTITGVATFAAGTAALPAITTTGDTNTGIWFPAADTIAFTEAGVESMRIDSVGSLGIGVTSIPSYTRLALTGTAGAQTDAKQQITVNAPTTTAGEGGGIRINAASGAKEAVGIIGVVNNASGNLGSMTFGVYNGGATVPEWMRIANNGIVTMSAYGSGTATFSAAGVISSVSDETWKIKDGVPVDPDSMLKKLSPGYWYYNDEKKEIFGVDRQLGFYAQNVNSAIGPEAAPVPETSTIKNNDGTESTVTKPWGYYDRSVLAVTVMSLQKALATIETLTARITALEGA